MRVRDFQILGKDVNRLSFVNNVIANNGSASIRKYPGGHGALGKPIWWLENRTNIVLETSGDFGVMPEASFTVKAEARVGEELTFRNTTKDADEIEHVLWDFDAGVPSTELNPEYTYEKTGVIPGLICLSGIKRGMWIVRRRGMCV